MSLASGVVWWCLDSILWICSCNVQNNCIAICFLWLAMNVFVAIVLFSSSQKYPLCLIVETLRSLVYAHRYFWRVKLMESFDQFLDSESDFFVCCENAFGCKTELKTDFYQSKSHWNGILLYIKSNSKSQLKAANIYLSSTKISCNQCRYFCFRCLY